MFLSYLEIIDIPRTEIESWSIFQRDHNRENKIHVVVSPSLVRKQTSPQTHRLLVRNSDHPVTWLVTSNYKIDWLIIRKLQYFYSDALLFLVRTILLLCSLVDDILQCKKMLEFVSEVPFGLKLARCTFELWTDF